MKRPTLAWRAALALYCGGSAVWAASDAPQQRTAERSRWSIEEPHGPQIPFDMTLDEGTNISLDVAPDGRTIVFDLLGDLYTIPIAGGTATRLTSGAAYDTQPRYSPDGKRLAFISDRSGTDHVWIASADGSSPAPLTAGADAQFMSPAWMSDGLHVLARRQATTAPPSLIPSRDQKVVALHVTGGRGFTIPTTDKATAVLGPAASPDGRWVYFAVRGTDTTQIHRYDRETGESIAITGGPGGATRPALSRDGRLLAFGRLMDATQSVIVRDLVTGAERRVYSEPGTGAHISGYDTESLPGYAFTPDAGAIIIALAGKIRRIDLSSGNATVIPFAARAQLALTERVTVPRRIDQGAQVSLKMLRWPHLTPDANRIVFGAAGKLFSYDPSARRAHVLADGPGLEYSPAVSPDGRWLAYVDWTDETGAHIVKMPIGGGERKRLTAATGLYQHLAWSPDSRRLTFVEAQRGLDNAETAYSDIRWVDAEREGPTHLVASVGARGIRRQAPRPQFNRAGDRVYFPENPELGWLSPRHTDLVSARLDGTDRRRHLRFVWADDMIPSPDEQWVAFTEGHDVFLTSLPPAVSGDPVEVKATGASALPVRRLSGDGGDFVAWAEGGRTVTWNWGPSFFRLPVGDLAAGWPQAPAAEIVVDASLPRTPAPARVALTGARILTMTEDAPIERGDILVENGRIAAIGRSGAVTIPAGTHVIDAAGKTIVPGFVDVHGHYEYRDDLEIFPARNWMLRIYLAYGVTTIRDPSARSQMIFTLAEMVETGATTGPRVFSTGDLLWGPVPCCPPIESLDEARRQVRRLKALGATSIKQYALLRREQQQWVVQACRDEGLVVTTHTLQRAYTQMVTAMDGHTGLEHAIQAAPLYKDMLSVFAKTGVFYAPTLVASGRADTYFQERQNVHDDEKLRRFTPHARLEGSRRLTIMPESEYPVHAEARVAADLVRAGGKVVMGSHGINREGLGAHWEIRSFVMGGMTPLQALRAATRDAAASLGMERDLGSLAPGLLADLLVLDANPLEDIKHTEQIRYVMKGGVLWRGDTLDQVWPDSRGTGSSSAPR